MNTGGWCSIVICELRPWRERPMAMAEELEMDRVMDRVERVVSARHCA